MTIVVQVVAPSVCPTIGRVVEIYKFAIWCQQIFQYWNMIVNDYITIDFFTQIYFFYFKIMNEVLEFLRNCWTYYLATVEWDQPRVRPFWTINIFEDKLYIQTWKSGDSKLEKVGKTTSWSIGIYNRGWKRTPHEIHVIYNGI